MERYHEIIPALAQIRDTRLANQDEKNVINTCIGLIHDKVQTTDGSDEASPEIVDFVRENMHVPQQLAQALVDNKIISIYDDLSGTLDNIHHVDAIANHIADQLPKDAIPSPEFRRTFALMSMCLHLTQPN